MINFKSALSGGNRVESILEQFSRIPTTCISDAMNGLNNLHSSIKPLKTNDKLIGRAYTVKMPVGDNVAVLKAIRTAKAGNVLVVDAKGDTYRGIAGDFVIGMAKTLSLGGLVADGVIRDLEGSKNLEFPVFCKGTTVAACGKAGGGTINVPISCGGTAINPGDIIAGDADGVVVIPRPIEQDVLKEALKKLELDNERAKNILGNPEAVKKYLDDVLP